MITYLTLRLVREKVKLWIILPKWRLTIFMIFLPINKLMLYLWRSSHSSSDLRMSTSLRDRFLESISYTHNLAFRCTSLRDRFSGIDLVHTFRLRVSASLRDRFLESISLHHFQSGRGIIVRDLRPNWASIPPRIWTFYILFLQESWGNRHLWFLPNPQEIV